MVPHVRGELRVALEVRREHLGVHGVGLRRGAVLVLVLVLICAAVKVGGALVLVGAAVLIFLSVGVFCLDPEGDLHRCSDSGWSAFRSTSTRRASCCCQK